MKNVTFCFLIIIVLQFSNFVFGAIPAGERAALIALYNSTNGDSWSCNDNWKTAPLYTDGFAMPGTEGNWCGLVVQGDHVTELFFALNNLTGSIPSQLGDLSNLRRLDLLKNQLSGGIPSELGNLSKLESLDLSENRLSGGIPPGLSNLKELENLNLGRNNLSGGIPSQLCDLPNLKVLYLGQNQLSGPIISELENLSHLESLGLDTNTLSGAIPPGLGNLTNLKFLSLDSNQLSGGIPPGFGNLGNLQILHLEQNRLSGEIPSELGALSKLKNLYLHNNQLSGGVPPEFGNLGNLQILYLEQNRLSGVIPSSLINLTKLVFLHIRDNCLFATDPTLIAWLNDLEPGWEAEQCVEKEPPFGAFETPISGSTVSSSIPITGWALDDHEMDRVKIYREQENALVFIGDAIFIEGARPDVEVAFPGYPNNNKAGWGYMLLTNLLPNGGNGTFVLHAIAEDKSGKTTTLGTKTIIVDNRNAIKPFGAIDTPTQGGTASGKEFVNFGWALTPLPNMIPIDGSTIDVIIDGVVKGHPGYNTLRSDIAELFPGFTNTNGAGGYYYIDTTKLTNGVHTIAWNITDNASNSDGIGSRYFSVTNTQTSGDSSVLNDTLILQNKKLSEEFLSPEPIEIKELERVEINLSGEKVFEGYLVVGAQLRKMPIGSTLDKERGIFYWQPGPGFVGEYRFVFIGKDNLGQFIKKNIIVNITARN